MVTGGLSSPRGGAARTVAPIATVRPVQPSPPAVPASQLLRQQQPPAAPAQTPLAGSTGRARRVSLVIQPNQIQGILAGSSVCLFSTWS